MKTHELVELLAADRTVAPAPGRTLGVWLAVGMLVSLALFLAQVGLRDDVLAAIRSVRFDFKILLCVALATTSAGLLLQLARPGGRGGNWSAVAWVLPLLLALAVGIELAVLPQAQWWEAARGSNATWCLRYIPMLAIAPLLAALWTLRQAAPSRPVLAGAVAGLLSSGIAGALYAIHCTDDSPLFVAIWYVLAAAVVTLLGALLGSRWLRW